ncbi:hypothetical protein Ciccas_012064, partial [Cichlidogyrus casuarinus]
MHAIIFACLLVQLLGPGEAVKPLFGVSPYCYVLDKAMEMYEMDNGSKIYNVGDMDVGDNGFHLVIRRHSDGLMTDGWYEPGNEYRVELRNKMQGVGFQDYILWLEPSTSNEEIDRTGQSKGMHRDMTDKERRVNKLERWGKIIRERGRRTKSDLGVAYVSQFQSEVGNWIHLPPVYLLPGVNNAALGITQDRLNCSGLVAERRMQGMKLALHKGRAEPVWEKVELNWRAPAGLPSSNLNGGASKMNNDHTNCVTIGAA